MATQEFLELARKDRGVFMSYVFGFPLAPMHKHWLKTISESKRVLIQAPKCHGKTSTVLSECCYAIGTDINIRIKTISSTDNRAKELSFMIFRVLNDPNTTGGRYHEVFPWVQLENQRGKQKIWVKRDSQHALLKDATVEALGVLSAAEGARSDLIIFDDVNGKRNTKTSGLRNQVKEMYYQVHINLLQPLSGRTIYIATPYHAEDLTTDLADRDDTYTKIFYTIDDQFTPLWPQVWPTEALRQRYDEIGPRRFNQDFRMMPGSDDSYVITEDLFRARMDPRMPLNEIRKIALAKIKEGAWRSIIGIDLATGAKTAKQKRKKDSSVIFTACHDKETKERIPVDIKIVQSTSPEVARLTVATYEDFKPEVIIFENNAYQESFGEWLKEMVKLPLQSNSTQSINKHDAIIGVKSLCTEFESLMWKIPYFDDHSPTCLCNWCIWKTQMILYPWGKKDDTVMAAWHAREGIRRYIEEVISSGRFAVWEH